MTSPTTNAPARPQFDLRAMFDGISAFFFSLTTAARMSQEIDRLLAMSDDDLASRGLRREDVVRHVFGLSMLG